ncbi:hypothetical protein CANMA_001939 [Candida margitis]|uniref:uncharacterized protein n=1 Tax=Candida margitis TaxID=1775924 RepID=UPI002227E5BF|nr:uncharacterized protein CANMA_001939 [Candida margitis]KAI5969027.1 hypothetical protein CANMA_001939 [Candida margitis]
MNFESKLYTDKYIDGLGNSFPLDPDLVDLDFQTAPLESCFCYSDYNEAVPPTKIEADNLHSNMECDDVDVDVSSEQDETYKFKRGPYRYYSEAQKQRFWQLVIEQGSSAYRAAQALNISLQTAYIWKRNWNRLIANEANGIHDEPKKRGRKPLLTQEHKLFLKDLVLSDPTVTLDFLLDKLRSTFEGVKASISTIYNFLIKDKIDLEKNCLFIDEAGFNISMRREYGWSKVGEKVALKVPVTRGLNVSFLGAISSKGCIDLKVRLPVETSPNKKRKIDSTTVSEKKTRVGTTADHFYSFVKSVLREIETNKTLQEIKYLILGNAAIHKRRDLKLLVASSGMELVFLPAYSPSLNAIEEFWSVCKAKVKRSNLSRKEQLTPRVREATAKMQMTICNTV